MKKDRFLRIKILFTGFMIVFFFGSVFDLSQAQTLLVPGQMKEELEYAADLIRRIHPDPFYQGSLKEFNTLLDELVKEASTPLPKGKFYFVLTRLLRFCGDAHTLLDDFQEQLFVPAVFRWANDGLVVIKAKEGCGLEFGDKILSIGCIPPGQLLENLNTIIPSENIYRLKEMSSRRLSSSAYLEYLGLTLNQQVEFTVENIQGTMKTIWITLDTERFQMEKDELCGWTIEPEHSLGYFYLNECLDNDNYKKALHDFFSEVKEKGITRIALDLRRNTGGNPNVLNVFLGYLSAAVKSGWWNHVLPSDVEGYGTEIRYSPEASEQRGYSKTSGYLRYNPLLRSLGVYKLKAPPPPSPDLIFYGTVAVLTSNRTFSAAHSFAVTIQDNGLGKVIGEPTGNHSVFCGDPLTFKTPYSDLTLNISHMKNYCPDTSREPQETCYPDIYIPTTIQDIRLGRDAQMDYLRSLFSMKKSTAPPYRSKRINS